MPMLPPRSQGRSGGGWEKDSSPRSRIGSGEWEPLGKAHPIYINVYFWFPQLLRQCSHLSHASLCKAHAPHHKGQMKLSASTNFTVTKMKSDSGFLRALWTDTLKPAYWQQLKWGAAVSNPSVMFCEQQFQRAASPKQKVLKMPMPEVYLKEPNLRSRRITFREVRELLQYQRFNLRASECAMNIRGTIKWWHREKHTYYF